MGYIKFNYADFKTLSLRDKKRVKEFIVTIFDRENKELKGLTYVFCSDEHLLQINKSFLNHDYYTDIITFDLSDGIETIGEIYISVDRVKDNSKTHAVTYEQELLRVIFHGALHLCGYKDKKKSEITIMREKEDYYLSLFAQK